MKTENESTPNQPNDLNIVLGDVRPNSNLFLKSDLSVDNLSMSQKIELIRPFTPEFACKSDESIKSYWGATSRMAEKAMEIISQAVQQKHLSGS